MNSILSSKQCCIRDISPCQEHFNLYVSTYQCMFYCWQSHNPLDRHTEDHLEKPHNDDCILQTDKLQYLQWINVLILLQSKNNRTELSKHTTYLRCRPGPHLSHHDSVSHHHTILQFPHIPHYWHIETNFVPVCILQAIYHVCLLKNKISKDQYIRQLIFCC